MKYRLLAPHTAPEAASGSKPAPRSATTPSMRGKTRTGRTPSLRQVWRRSTTRRGKRSKGCTRSSSAPSPTGPAVRANQCGRRATKEKEEQQKLDEGSEPVSEQQHLEREWDKEREKRGHGPRGEPAPSIPSRGTQAGMHPRPGAEPGPAREPSHTASAAPTRGGATPARGVATPKPPEGDEARPKNPNEDQYPKG